MQMFLQSLRQQTGSFSPTADILKEDIPGSNVQKYANAGDLSASSDDMPAADSSEDSFEKPSSASVPPVAVV